ncbi:sigma-70 family RNA polymerase sigma factor [Actinomadura opuntiae]|uniref:sigma-70 family RNA polymerase sigma factor n=1 Tax=Actinomadura sp. OS1-43 TaxID=604315 RepID=UPI00255B199C|nr:sigma-70 family RNA polymerase sigma factor [Actinomadura sp. OS1-43]MDL4816913.1 sigma-70 family RNA polymerase sigma factor [Actinomadura sp. OS1-43]
MIDEDFEARVGPHRRELLVHCYRMLGSVHEAEDLVQETMLRAWRARERYDAGRASVRTWLYKIATNACLTALEGRARRPLPSGLGGPSDDPGAPLVPALDVPWLQPFPDALLDDPAVRAVRRGTLRLALIAAMQVLPPKQRAVLILRDVLEFPAAEVAALLETTPAAVNSALQRARTGLEGASPAEDEVAEPGDAVDALVDRYVRSFEAADVAGLVALLTEDAVMEMPPVPLWYLGRDSYGRFMERVFEMNGPDWRLVRTAANTQPAVAAYHRGDGGAYLLHTLQVFTVTPRGIARNVVFQDARVFAAFDLPPVLDTAREG